MLLLQISVRELLDLKASRYILYPASVSHDGILKCMKAYIVEFRSIKLMIWP